MTASRQDDHRPIFGFGQAARLAGVSQKQLRNFMEPGRSILRSGSADLLVVGAKVGSEWRFSRLDVLLIHMVSQLNQSAGIPPRIAIRLVERLYHELRAALVNLPSLDPVAGTVIVVGFDAASEALLFAQLHDGSWKALVGNEWAACGDRRPDIIARPHARIPIEAIVAALGTALDREPT